MGKKKKKKKKKKKQRIYSSLTIKDSWRYPQRVLSFSIILYFMSVKQETFTKAWPSWKPPPRENYTAHPSLTHSKNLWHFSLLWFLIIVLQDSAALREWPHITNSSYWGLETLAVRARSQLFNVHIIELQ